MRLIVRRKLTNIEEIFSLDIESLNQINEDVGFAISEMKDDDIKDLSLRLLKFNAGQCGAVRNEAIPKALIELDRNIISYLTQNNRKLKDHIIVERITMAHGEKLPQRIITPTAESGATYPKPFVETMNAKEQASTASTSNTMNKDSNLLINR